VPAKRQTIQAEAIRSRREPARPRPATEQNDGNTGVGLTRLTVGGNVADWWSADPTERYWCEITDRVGVGDDLKCPQGYEGGREYWSYSFIKEVMPGDIIYHYSTPRRAFWGVSVAGGPLEERDIVWQAHGTVGRSQTHAPVARPGWWLPLYGYCELPRPLPLSDLHNPVDEAWVRTWIAEKDQAWNRVAAPLQRYGER
jgi:hypothetical protein